MNYRSTNKHDGDMTQNILRFCKRSGSLLSGQIHSPEDRDLAIVQAKVSMKKKGGKRRMGFLFYDYIDERRHETLSITQS